MSLQLYDRVALRASFPEHALRAGDVATLVDFVDHPSSGRRGCVLELFNALGESMSPTPTESLGATHACRCPDPSRIADDSTRAARCTTRCSGFRCLAPDCRELSLAAIRWKCAFTHLNAVSRKNLTDAGAVMRT